MKPNIRVPAAKDSLQTAEDHKESDGAVDDGLLGIVVDPEGDRHHGRLGTDRLE